MEIQEIKNIAYLAGQEILKHYNNDLQIAYKKDNSPLTEADLASDRIIKEGLKKYGFPILSEEATDDFKKRKNSDYVWIVDPLDGTSDFIQKTDEFAVMIGLANKEGGAVLGVVYAPALGELYFAEKGKGSFCEENGKIKKNTVSGKENFSEMAILLSRNHLLETEIKISKKLDLMKKHSGSAGLKICRIAEGKAEIYINSSNKSSEWDTCAGNIILQEAGGRITDVNGEELDYNRSNPRHCEGYVVSNGKCHQSIINELKNCNG